MKELLIDGGVMFIGMTVQIYVQAIILNIIFDTKLSNKQKLIYGITLGLVTTLIKLFKIDILTMLNPLFFILTSTFLLLIFRKTTFAKAFLYSIAAVLISIPVEIISGTIAFQILKLPNHSENVIATIPVLILMPILYMIIAGILHLFKKRKNINLHFNGRLIGVNIIFVSLLLIPNIMFYAMNQYNYPLWLLIYNILANIVLVILAVYNTYNNIQLETKKRDLENSEMYNKTLKELVDSIRVFKHDYNNVVHSLGGYVSLSDMAGLKKYYDGLSKESKRVNRMESVSPTKINEPSVYGLIASKYQTAEERNIEFNIESMIDYTRIDMPIYDFCKILGIFLDNAIEAAEETKEKIINIQARESFKDKIQLFVIENSYLDKDVDTNMIYEKDYSTKNRNSGIGLWEVKNIVDRNENVTLITNKTPEFFRQELYIQVREKEENIEN